MTRGKLFRIETGNIFGINEETNAWEGKDFHNLIFEKLTMFDATNTISSTPHELVINYRAREKLFLCTVRKPFLNKAALGNFLFITA